MQADGRAASTTLDLDAGQRVPGLRSADAFSRNIYGFVVSPFGTARASFALPPRTDERRTLFVSAGNGPDLTTGLTLVDSAGHRRPLGAPSAWQRHRIDLPPSAGTGRERLEFTTTNSGRQARLFADQVRVVDYSAAAVPDAGRWEVALWAALAVLLVLALLGRLRRDGVLALGVGLAVFLV